MATVTVLDQRADANGLELATIYSTCQPPDFVKTASSEQICGGDDLAAHLYALPGRLYPLHTAAATWVSQAFYQTKRAMLSPQQQQLVERRLADAGKYFGIAPWLSRLTETLQKQADVSLTNLPDDLFGYVWQPEDGGPKQRHWPLRNAMEVKAATAHLQQYRDHFCYRDRQKIAARILTKAADYASDLAPAEVDFLERQAGYAACLPPAAVALLEQRALLCSDRPEYQGELQKLATALRQAPELLQQHDVATELVATVENIDRELHVRYGGSVRRPEDALFALSKTAVAEMLDDHVVLTTGNMYATRALSKLPLSGVAAVFGQKMASAMSADGVFLNLDRLAETLPVLPRPDAALFEQLAADHGIQPVEKVARAAPLQMTDDELQLLAAQA